MNSAMRFAYADPPYIGQAKRHYGASAREVNHRLLIDYLDGFDGWALSLSSPTLRTVLPMCPDAVRVMAWVKPFCSFKPGMNPAYAWEPVIVKVGRKLGRDIDTVRDYVSANITLQKGVSGAKPEAFCHWVFDVMGMDTGDEFEDVFPGSGAVSRALRTWKAQRSLWERSA
jgi:hypothetical protein